MRTVTEGFDARLANQQFIANVNSCLRSLYAIARPPVVSLSFIVFDFRALWCSTVIIIIIIIIIIIVSARMPESQKLKMVG